MMRCQMRRRKSLDGNQGQQALQVGQGPRGTDAGGATLSRCLPACKSRCWAVPGASHGLRDQGGRSPWLWEGSYPGPLSSSSGTSTWLMPYAD